MTSPRPREATLLCRISDARNDDAVGVERQEEDLYERADQLGWGIRKPVLVENDTSAFKRRKILLPNGAYELRTVRPKFRQAIADLASGKSDGLLALDLDRVCRDPRDLEDLIDVIESRRPRIPVESCTGSLRLANDADVTMARVMVAMANKSSRDTARRVAAARRFQAENGLWGGGRRPFGFGIEGTRIDKRGNEMVVLDMARQRPDEAAEIATAINRVIAGHSLRSLAADLRERGVPTVTGARWTSNSLKCMLLRPRNAGLVVYDGKIIEGVELNPHEDPVVAREVWEACVAVLTNPKRNTVYGATPRWLGSGIYLCGHPDCVGTETTLQAGRSGDSHHRPVYKCYKSAHLTRTCKHVDEYVVDHLIGRLSLGSATTLLAVQAPEERGELQAEATRLRAKIVEATDAWEAGVFDLAELKVRRGRLEKDLDDVTGKLRRIVGDPLTDLAGNPDAAEVWEGMSLAAQREVLKDLLTVVVKPSPKGRPPGWKLGQPYFDRNSVEISWNR